ncbi:cysteine-rich receptor-like protein kinase, partial [Trifolium medium]|nr:cysteine-rich receptor-like protein kinase [Trifolium medium]
RGTSAWWRDVSLLGGSTDSTSDWYSEGIRKKVGDGLMTSFWFEMWIGDTPLKVQYQRLFQVSEQSNSKVGEMGT